MPADGDIFIFRSPRLKVGVWYLCALIFREINTLLRLHPYGEQGEECDEGRLNIVFHPE